MAQNYQNPPGYAGGPPGSGWTVNGAPGATGNQQQQGNWTGYPPPPYPPPGMSPQSGQAQKPANITKKGTPGQSLITGGGELGLAIGVNIFQIITSFYSTLLAEDAGSLHKYGWFGGVGVIWNNNPMYIAFALLIALGAQTLLQAGCQRIKTQGVHGNIQAGTPMLPQVAEVAVELIFSEKWGAAMAIAGLAIDSIGDCFFVLTVGLNFVLFLLIVVLMNALATWALYDGWERFHFGWIAWYQMKTWKWAVRQAALEKARMMVRQQPQQPYQPNR